MISSNMRRRRRTGKIMRALYPVPPLILYIAPFSTVFPVLTVVKDRRTNYSVSGAALRLPSLLQPRRWQPELNFASSLFLAPSAFSGFGRDLRLPLSASATCVANTGHGAICFRRQVSAWPFLPPTSTNMPYHALASSRARLSSFSRWRV